MPNTVTEAKRTQARPSEIVQRSLPIGAESHKDKGVHFRVWAPRSKAVAVEFQSSCKETSSFRSYSLKREGNGYFSGLIAPARAGMLYKYRLDSGVFPDPASRFQPQGPHGPSQIIDPSEFHWTDQAWQGASRQGQVIYELHTGTFTREGTWAAAAGQLTELGKLGITLIELMPVAEFCGQFGWGYDGVDLFAPTRLYGMPDDLRAFVDRAHALGLGVILDVVYNHFGPDGCYVKEFSADYISTCYENEWGEAINFDGDQSASVREFFISNAIYWIQEFHFDGFRFDATQQIFDSSPRHILREIAERSRQAAGKKSIYLSAENETQNVRLARPIAEDGYDLDSLWNDDFHHSARVALTGRNEAYYTDYKGSPQELISAMKRGYLYQGQPYAWQKQCRGTSTLGMRPAQFVNFIENHDQIANSLRGERIHALTSPGEYRALTALFLLGPGTPLIFQGQEFAASSPFVFFADHNHALNEAVEKGRHDFLRQFPSAACPEAQNALDTPGSEQTFLKCKLDLQERESHAPIYKLHRDLLQLRKESFRGSMDGAVLSADAFVLRFFGDDGNDRLLVINLGIDLILSPAPEPLLAPPLGRRWELKWSSEDPSYGGGGTPPVDTSVAWRIPGRAAIVFEPAEEKPQSTTA